MKKATLWTTVLAVILLLRMTGSTHATTTAPDGNYTIGALMAPANSKVEANGIFEYADSQAINAHGNAVGHDVLDNDVHNFNIVGKSWVFDYVGTSATLRASNVASAENDLLNYPANNTMGAGRDVNTYAEVQGSLYGDNVVGNFECITTDQFSGATVNEKSTNKIIE